MDVFVSADKGLLKLFYVSKNVYSWGSFQEKLHLLPFRESPDDQAEFHTIFFHYLHGGNLLLTNQDPTYANKILISMSPRNNMDMWLLLSTQELHLSTKSRDHQGSNCLLQETLKICVNQHHKWAECILLSSKTGNLLKRYFLLDFLKRLFIYSRFISYFFLESGQVHRLLNYVTNFVKVVFTHSSMLLNGFFNLHLLF